MKKILVACFLFCGTLCNHQTVSAKEPINNEVIVYQENETLDNGIVVTTTIKEEPVVARVATKRASKTVEYKNGSTVLWYVKVTGTFEYTNIIAKCISSSVETKSLYSNWTVSNAKTWKEINHAYASATGKRYVSGVLKETINREVKLTCSATGNLS